MYPKETYCCEAAPVNPPQPEETLDATVGELMKQIDEVIEACRQRVNSIENHLNGFPLSQEKPVPRKEVPLRKWLAMDLDMLKSIDFMLENINKMV